MTAIGKGERGTQVLRADSPKNQLCHQELRLTCLLSPNMTTNTAPIYQRIIMPATARIWPILNQGTIRLQLVQHPQSWEVRSRVQGTQEAQPWVLVPRPPLSTSATLWPVLLPDTIISSHPTKTKTVSSTPPLPPGTHHRPLGPNWIIFLWEIITTPRSSPRPRMGPSSTRHSNSIQPLHTLQCFIMLEMWAKRIIS